MSLIPAILNGGVILLGPSADGALGQVLTTDGAGNLSFATPPAGEQGEPGPPGDPGAPGDPGETGPAGVGVPAGGTTGLVLAKASNDDYDTHWVGVVSAVSPLILTAASASQIPLTVRGAASQTANLQEWQDSSSNNVVSLTPAGRLRVHRPGTPASYSEFYYDNATGSLRIDGLHPTGGFAYFGTVFTAFNNSGVWHIGGSTVDVTAQLKVTSAAATIKGLVVRLHASQTARAFELHNSSNSLLMGIHQTGAVEPASLADSSAPNNSIYYSSTASKLVYKDSGGTVHNLY